MTTSTKKLIWDVPTRIFHWLLVILIAVSWYSIEIAENVDIHMYSGYCLLTLVLFRIIWGFAGTRYARFSSCLYSPGKIFDYTKTLFSREPGRYGGHNPLGGIAVLLMLASLTVQVGTGLVANDEYSYFGPLYDYVPENISSLLTSIHYTNFDILLVLIGIHIIAVLLYLLVKKDNLITPMFTGKKTDVNDRYEAISHSKVMTAAVLIIVLGIAVFCMVYFLGS